MARKGKEQDSTVSLKSEEEWQEILNSQVLIKGTRDFGENRSKQRFSVNSLINQYH